MAQLKRPKPLPRRQKTLASRPLQAEARLPPNKVASITPQKARRWRPGTVALREIRRMQNSTDFLIQRSTFRRFLREVVFILKDNYRMSAACVDAIQEATEMYITSLLMDANLCTLHANRVTLFPKDINLALKLRGERN